MTRLIRLTAPLPLLLAACGVLIEPAVTPTPPVAATVHPCDAYTTVARTFDRLAREASVEMQSGAAVPAVLRRQREMEQAYASLPPLGGSAPGELLHAVYGQYLLALAYALEGNEDATRREVLTWRSSSDFAGLAVITHQCG